MISDNLNIPTHNNQKSIRIQGHEYKIYPGGTIINKLKGSIQIVIGTLGHLLDHLKRGSVDFKKLKMLVLDEAGSL